MRGWCAELLSGNPGKGKTSREAVIGRDLLPGNFVPKFVPDSTELPESPLKSLDISGANRPQTAF
jgi:hypothetical protein